MQNQISTLNAAELLAFRIIFSDESEAQSTWQEFIDNFSIDDLRQELIPLVFRRLKPCTTNNFAGIMRGCCRYQWSKNQVVLQQIADRIDHLNKQSIPFMLGGLYSVFHHGYQDSALRSICAVNFITLPSHVQHCTEIVHNSVSDLRSPGSITYNVSTKILDDIGPMRARRSWSDSVETSVLGRRALSLCAEDALIWLLCGEHSGSSPVPWFADVLTMLQALRDPTYFVQKLQYYRIARIAQKKAEPILKAVDKIGLKDSAGTVQVLQAVRVGTLESVISSAPAVARLLALGSELICRKG